MRVRRGVYMPRDAHTSIISAGRFGSITCVSALALHGVWIMPHRDLHVRVGADSRVRAIAGMRIHRRGKAPRVALESPIDSLVDLVRCADDLAIVVAVDSLLNMGLASLHEVERFLVLTRRGRRILSRVDGRAESGIESIVRVRLRARGIRLRTQVSIRGIGRVDMLIGDRLVVEVDGRGWHDRESSFESDRRRDAALVVRGFLVLRYSYKRVMEDWEAVEREVLSLIRRDRHVARNGRSGRTNA